jgi:hypothetical protein
MCFSTSWIQDSLEKKRAHEKNHLRLHRKHTGNGRRLSLLKVARFSERSLSPMTPSNDPFHHFFDREPHVSGPKATSSFTVSPTIDYQDLERPSRVLLLGRVENVMALYMNRPCRGF